MGAKGGGGLTYPKVSCGSFGKGFLPVEDFEREHEEELEHLPRLDLEEDFGVFGQDSVDEADAVLGDFRVCFWFWAVSARCDEIVKKRGVEGYLGASEAKQ